MYLEIINNAWKEKLSGKIFLSVSLSRRVPEDSFKIRGSNSLKNNFNKRKLKQHLNYIETQIKDYEAQLDANDKVAGKKIEERKEKRSRYQQTEKEL